ncbi:murein L,D-transpeptidase [Marinicauda salina]|uniref:Murein L,D-transpeptidase n=1 Tax=Marinicauda salina TaxID=2135793 RepID=A0A2U2BX17_9PROT|nr:L,D-transpeptidase family protein [Marinicauda salina]PWE18552.1 murein L,D-transpeptidase [Marinicauda salina]
MTGLAFRIAIACVFVLAAGAAPARASEHCAARVADAETRFHAARADRPVWTGPDNAHRYSALVEAVRGAASHGLDPADYGFEALRARDPRLASHAAERAATRAWLRLACHLDQGRLDPHRFEPDRPARPPNHDLALRLREALATDRVIESLEALAPQDAEYAALRAALARYEILAGAATDAPPDVPAGDALRPGDKGRRVEMLRARLRANGLHAADPGGAPRFDDGLARAVQEFQRQAGLEPDAVVGPLTLAALNLDPAERAARIRVNLERRRWLMRENGGRRIVVNIPAFRLEARSNGAVERVHDVIVGQPSRSTPAFSAPLQRFVINPWWETPFSIAILDELPSFRRDPAEVRRLGFQVVDRTGDIVDPDTIDWNSVSAEAFPYRLRQAPGPLNALGEIKLLLDAPHGVHLHDTPNRELFDRERRAFSSGCIRVRDVMKLADWALQDTPAWPPQRVRKTAEGAQATPGELAESLPVHIVYWTVVADGESGVRFLEDLYGRDGALIAALEAPARNEEDHEPDSETDRPVCIPYSDGADADVAGPG